MFPVYRPIAYIMLQGLGHTDALRDFSGVFHLTSEGGEFSETHPIEIQCTVHDFLCDFMIPMNELLRSVDLGLVADCRVDQLCRCRGPGLPVSEVLKLIL